MLGQWIMYPIVMQWRNTPVVHAILIPELDYDFTTPRSYPMYKIPNLKNDKKELVVNIAPLSRIHAEYEKRSGEYNSSILGFYSYEEHDIWTIDSTDILVHEMRHIFEGGFHRSAEDIEKYGKFKVFYGF